MSDTKLLEASCRIALATMLHDLGKFAERARINVDAEILENNKQLYCKHRKRYETDPGWFTHVHAAYTALALDMLEPHFPKLTGEDVSPFSSWKSDAADDSLINAAARHHNPETFLQWVIATADRVASGFEREEFEKYNQSEEKTVTGKNHYTARQFTLFESIRLHEKGKNTREQFHYRYPLKPLSPAALFPVEAAGYEKNDKESAQKEYSKLWKKFLEGLEGIPPSHRTNLSLWLDHFETLWGVFTQAIPSATAGNTRPDVSLYDHSRATTTLATALWRYHHERDDAPEAVAEAMQSRDDWNNKKFLLIQGDFFGIQDFIFASGGETNKRAAKLLRGRSFYVSLLTECAALRVLDELALPATSQIINAAGKFLIVAPNTEQTKTRMEQVQRDLDQWFLQQSWGTAGIGLAWQPACCNDFIRSGKEGASFQHLMKRLFEQLETAKLRRFSLVSNEVPDPVFRDFLDSFDNQKGVCAIDGRSPGEHPLADSDDRHIGDLAHDQIAIGDYLVKHQRLLITREKVNQKTLMLPVFGYHITFTQTQDVSGKFGDLARNRTLLRFWDFGLPKSADDPLWNGYARRHINAYIPHFDEQAKCEERAGKYDKLDESIELGDPKTLNHIACEDRKLDADEKWYGKTALMTLKGDVDNLGMIFQQGLGALTFAKMAALSRLVNAFFAIYLPWLCRTEYENSYTVFAGGDDFFLIGPWHSQIELARRMRSDFQRYVACNPEIHFSAGLSMSKPGLPVTHLAHMAEQALDAAKAHPAEVKSKPKNAVSCFNRPVTWIDFIKLLEREQCLSELTSDLELSTGYVYGLLQLVDMAERIKDKPENAIWHSYFAYRTWRMLERRKSIDNLKRGRLQNELGDEIANKGIETHGGDYRIALFTHLYQQRN